MAVRRRDLPKDPKAVAICKELNQLCGATGYNPDDVFSDWLEICDATCRMAPLHAKSLLETGKMAEDPEDVQKLWERVTKKYKHDRVDVLKVFAQAFAMLQEAAVDSNGHIEYEEILGPTYMAWGSPASNLGQFFTPYHISKAMADMTMGAGAGPAEVHERIKKAINRSPLAQALLVSSHAITDPQQNEEFYLEKLIPACLPYYDPITIIDPCCGAGAMLMASASQYPHWMLRLGLVLIYGIDLDPTCVQMCRINLAIRGIDPSNVVQGNSLMPETYQKFAYFPRPIEDEEETLPTPETPAEEVPAEAVMAAFEQASLFESVGSD